MSIQRLSLLASFLLLTAGAVCAQTNDAATNGSHDGAWFSYRDTYQSMIRFEKYGKPKQFIQNQLQVIPQDKTVPLDGLRLSLTGKATHLNLPLDPVGRAVFPLLKAAYDENAELRINRPSGSVRLESRISILTRPDGVYEMADLHTACDQALQYLHYAGYPPYSSKQCVGVKFSYPKDATGVVLKFRNPDSVLIQLPITEGGVFWDESISAFKIVMVRFSDWPDKGQIMTDSVPLAIAAMFE